MKRTAPSTANQPQNTSGVRNSRPNSPRGNKPVSISVSEAQIENTVSQWLELDGWRSLKTDPVSRREWGKGFGELGMADRLYIRYGCSALQPLPFPYNQGQIAEVFWIEFKAKRGVVAQHQEDWHKLERMRGARVLVAGVHFGKSIEQFQKWYRESGMMLRNI